MLFFKKYLAFLLLCSTSTITLASDLPDTSNITIHITARTSLMFNARYWWDIYKTNDKIKIVYSRAHAVLRDGVKIYKDSIWARGKDFAGYNSLLTNIRNTGVNDFENKEATKNRFVLDGTRFNFKIISASDSKEVNAHSPSEITHPLLYQLLHQTEDIYRNNYTGKPVDVSNVAFHMEVATYGLGAERELRMHIYRNKNRIKIIYAWHGKTADSLFSDSLVLNKKAVIGYDSLLNRIANTKDLKNKPTDKKFSYYHDNYVHLDIIFKTDFHEFWLTSPDASSNPLVYDLLTQTLALYHGNMENIFLDKQKMFGY